MQENNISKSKMEDLLEEQQDSYVTVLEGLMGDKSSYIKNLNLYESEIFSLKKIISINTRAGNKYAVLRDKVQLDAYTLIANQNRLIKDVLLLLDSTTKENIDDEITKYVIKNQKSNEQIYEKNYKKFLDIEPSSKVVRQLQTNVKEFYALVEINQDVINHIYLFQNRMYRLNKYSKYQLIGLVLYVNSLEIVKQSNNYLVSLGLDIAKIMIMLSLSVIMYFFRTLFLLWVERYIINTSHLKAYVTDIVEGLKSPINYILIIININMIIYVYNDFSSVEVVSKTFNIIYAIVLTYMFYKALNLIASAKIHEFHDGNKQIKNEVINVGIKVINFLIMIIGLLIVLYLAGVNLTAVLSGLGIGGFAVALAAKDSLANFFGTLSIMMSDVYSQGDWIVVDGQEGVVVELGLRVTTLRTFDNALVAIPNAILANKDVKNWNKRELGRRIKMSLGVRYDSKSKDIKQAVIDIREMLEEHSEIATENTEYNYNPVKTAKLVSKDDLQGVKKTLLVYLDEFSESSINILIYCFTKSVDWDQWLKTKEDVMHKIMEIFEKNNLEFAFPSMSLYSEKDEESSTENKKIL